MEENLKQESSKNRKSNKIAVVLLSAIVIVCAALVGLYASGILGVPVGTKPATEEALEKASNVTDEATLRELLLMNCELDIKVTEDIEITETLVVNGIKKVTSDNLLKASFELEDGAAMLDISKKASLTIDGWNLDGKGVALGVNVNRNATFNHLAGKMEYMGTYGVVSAGLANLSEKTEISHVGEGAIKVALEGEMNVEGGTYTDGGNYLANVEAGGVLNISGDALFDGAVNYLVYNYGETTIHGGTFLNSGYRGITNFAKITMDYEGSDEDGYIEVGNTGNVAVYTSSTFKVSYKDVYAHDAGANVFLQSNTGARCYVEDCVFDTGKGNAVSIRGEVYFTNVEVKNAEASGILVQQNGVATFKNVNIDNSKGRGISVESATLRGEGIKVSGTGGVGIAAQVFDNIGPASVELSDVYLSDVKGNSIKVVNGANMNISDSVFEKSKRTSVYVEKGTIVLADVDVLGTLDKDVNVVQVQKDGELTISGKTLITGGTMRAVGIYGGKLTMNDGIIRDNNASETGAAVHITKVNDSAGTFTMNGGIICNNTTANEKKNAGGVNVSANAVFVMKGGEIYGNSTSNYGGGVRVDKGATFKMSGGSIYKNAAKAGAGVYIDPTATVSMSGGAIYQNKSKASGAGIYLAGTLNLSGGKIYQNVATTYGGAMNIVKSKVDEKDVYGTLNMTGGSIYGNSATSGGGGIQVSSGAIANLSGGSVTDNETGGIGDGIRVSGEVTISDDFYVGNDKVALTSKDVTLKVTGSKLSQHSAKDPLLVAVADGVSTGHVVVECDDNDAAVSILTHTASGNGAYILTQKEKNLVVNYAAADMDMTGADKVYVSNFQQLKEAVEGTTSKRYVIISSDIEMEGTITVPNGTTVYLRDDGVQRTLSRQKGKTSTFFNTRYGTGLYLVGTSTGNLVLDGEISSDAKASVVASLVTAQGGTVIDGVTFINNGSHKNNGLAGAFIYQKYGHIDIYDSSFEGAQAASGAVGLATLATGYVENCSFTNNSALRGGGAIRLEKNAELTVKDSVFENNSAGSSGGAIVSEGGTFTAIDCDFKNNTATNDGGVIKLNGGTAKFLDEDGKINFADNNTSGNAGGAIWAKGILAVEAYSFDKNMAGTNQVANGGAIHVEGQTTIATVTDSTFSNNESEKNCGGAISNAGSILTIDGSVFIGNKTTAAKLNGGAVYSNNNNASTTISNSRFFDNKAKDGGAIRVTAGTIEIENCTFDNNKATESGGAICTTPANENSVVKVKVKGGSFVGNNAVNGGAIFNGQKDNKAYSVVETENVAFDGNYTTGNTAGAIYVQATYTDHGSTFQNNKACDVTGNVTKNGGALYLNNEKSAVKLTNTTFDGNEAKDGGAIRFVSGTVVADGCTFKNNKTSTGNGGAICSQNSAKTENIVSLKVNNSTFSNNNAASAGGAIYAISGTVEITESNFDANSANGASANLGGGAICVEDGKVTITGKEDLSNKFTNNSAANAGAINVTDKANAEVVVENYVFEENSATTGNGGAIRAADQTKLVACQFNKNHADTYWGGAVYVTNASKGIITSDSTDVSFVGNTANEGGAIYYNTANTLDADSWTFEKNSAITNGGAIYKAAGSVTIKNSDFGKYVADAIEVADKYLDGNIAGTSGGAIYNKSGDMTFENTNFYGNKAGGNGNEGGGAILVSDGTVTLTGKVDAKNVIAGNTSLDAGAINVADSANAHLVISNYKFEDNQATGNAGAIRAADEIELTDCEFNRNTAKNLGGAIYVTNATKGLIASSSKNVSFSENVAKNGGALYYNTDNMSEVSAWDFVDNSTTEYGGAVYVAKGKLHLNGEGNFTGNTANVGGGAINVAAGSVTIKDFTFGGNVATTGDGGAIRNAATLTLEDCDFKKVNNVANQALAKKGGAIYLTGNGSITLKGTGEFSSNTAYQTGGAIFLNSGTITAAEGADYTFDGNSASTGGALYVQSGSFTAANFDFTNNIATGGNLWTGYDFGGGAIVLGQGGNTSVTLTGTGSISNNKSMQNTNGGAISVMDARATLNVSGYTFENNGVDGSTVVTANGGAIYNNGGTVTVTGAASFRGNAAKNAGGAIYSSSGKNVSISEMDFENNKSMNQGGAIYVYATSAEGFSVTKSNFTANRANGDGGAIMHFDGMLTVTDCNFTNNSAATYNSVTPRLEGFTNAGGNGGAIYIRGDADALITATAANTYSFTGNTAWRDSDGYIWGAIASNSTGDVRYSAKYTFSNNTHANQGDLAAGCGIHGEGKTLIRMDEADSYAATKAAVTNAGTKETTEITLLGNIEIGDQRIDVDSGQDVVIKNAKDVSVVISRTEASANNMFNVNASGKLKFMSNTEGGTLTIDGKNVAKASMLYGRGVLELNGIVLKNGNSGNGSAVQLRNNTAQLIANDCTFESNVSTDKGGAITLTTDDGTNTYPTIQIANTKFESNICATNGGAICAEGGTIYLLGQVDFTGNKASGESDVYGGALYLKNVTLTSEPTDAMKQTGFTTSGIVNFTNNNTVTSNRDKNNNGGAIYQTGGTISLMGGGTFTGNKAGANNVNKGAGGAINTMGTVNLKNYDFKQNIAIKDGGAIRVDAATVNVENCNFVSNSAGTSAELTGNDIYNGRGGAIYLSGNSANRLNLTGTGKFESNVYTHTSDGVIKNAIYKSQGAVTGADLYTYVDNTNNF